MAYNVSAVGSKVIVDGVEIKDFADDASPYSVQPIETGGTAMTIKDTLLFYNVHNGVRIDISVLPGSKSDADLYKISKEREQSDSGIKIAIANKDNTYIYEGCFSVNDHVGVEAKQDGRLKGKTYSFIGENGTSSGGISVGRNSQ